jgi:hypothetical protein
MNLAWLKLILAALWLVPGVAFLVMEWTGGPVIALPIAGRQVPLAWPFIVLGLFNVARWWVSRTNTSSSSWIDRRRSRHPATDLSEPNFKLEDDV